MQYFSPHDAARGSLDESATSELHFREVVKGTDELTNVHDSPTQLSTFATSDGDALPVHRKKAPIVKHSSSVHLVKTYSHLHCKMFPASLPRGLKQTGTLGKPSVKAPGGPLSSFCCVSNAQSCT